MSEPYIAIQTVMLPKDTNPHGTIFGGIRNQGVSHEPSPPDAEGARTGRDYAVGISNMAPRQTHSSVLRLFFNRSTEDFPEVESPLQSEAHCDFAVEGADQQPIPLVFIR